MKYATVSRYLFLMSVCICVPDFTEGKSEYSVCRRTSVARLTMTFSQRYACQIIWRMKLKTASAKGNRFCEVSLILWEIFFAAVSRSPLMDVGNFSTARIPKLYPHYLWIFRKKDDINPTYVISYAEYLILYGASNGRCSNSVSGNWKDLLNPKSAFSWNVSTFHASAVRVLCTR